MSTPMSHEEQIAFNQKNKTVYFSFDIEADGPSPAKNSMLSFGLVVFDQAGKEIGSLKKNLQPRPGAVQDKRCMEEFWAKQPEAWKRTTENAVDPKEFAEAVADMWKAFEGHGKRVWIANPAAYDWQWLKYYYEAYKTEEMPDIGYSAKCIGTLWSSQCAQKGMSQSQEWDEEEKRMKEIAVKLEGHVPHDAEHDARVQGLFFFEMDGHDMLCH